MKARVKATGEIVDVRIDYKQDADYIAQNGQLYWQRELDFNNLNIKDEEITNTPGYWTRLEHQAAIAAMQSYVSNNVYLREIREMCKEPQEMRDLIADLSILLATTLVQKLKEKEERK